MPSYLLELYLPHAGCAQASESARTVAEQAARRGPGVRHVRTLYVAEDETCFHVFEAPSRGALLEAARDAGLTDVRVTEAVQSDGAV